MTPDQQRKNNASRAIRLAKEGTYSCAAQTLKSDVAHAATTAVEDTLLNKHPKELLEADRGFELNEDVNILLLPNIATSLAMK